MQHSPTIPQHLESDVRMYSQLALANSTRKTYSSGEKQFLLFCLRNSTAAPSLDDILPASPNTLMAFAAELARTCKYHTIKNYLSAVRNLHLENGHPDPTTNNFGLDRVLQGIKRHKGTAKRTRFPITLEILTSIKPFLFLTHNRRDATMLWASFTLAFFGFLRCSEFTCPTQKTFQPQKHLCSSDVSFLPDLASPTYIEVRIKHSKTDQYGQGATLSIATSDSPICAVQALKEYITICNPQANQPLFRFASGKFLTLPLVTSTLRQCLKYLNVSSEKYASHSFRIGAATTAAEKGIPPWLIKVLGRWESDCFSIYIATPKNVLLSVAPRMATGSSFN